MDTLILASTSRYRKQLLIQAGYSFEAHAPGVDEEAIKKSTPDPLQLAQTLAQMKAEAGSQKVGKPWVVGSDQVACLGKKIFDKPGTKENALKTLELLQGQTHQLITSVCVIGSKERWTHTDITTLKMKPFTQKQLLAYIDTDEPFDCSGSFRLEAAGIRLFEKIESSDFTAIQGLPMLALGVALDKMGFKKDF